MSLLKRILGISQEVVENIEQEKNLPNPKFKLGDFVVHKLNPSKQRMLVYSANYNKEFLQYEYLLRVETANGFTRYEKDSINKKNLNPVWLECELIHESSYNCEIDNSEIPF